MAAESDKLFLELIAEEMGRYFGDDAKRIDHAVRVARYADKLLEREDADRAVVLSAAYLHDIGIKESERKYLSTAARYQHQEGPPIARRILITLKAQDDMIEEVCDIIGHHHKPRKQETSNFKIVYDADLIVNLEDKFSEKTLSPRTIAKLIVTRFLTASGRSLAQDQFAWAGKR